jgi:hypothetical protein
MAHLFSFAKNESAYYKGRYRGDRVQFPDTETFEDFKRPHGLVAEIFDLEVSGTISNDI